MKKVIILLCLFFLVVGCETKEERDEKKKQEEIKKVTEKLDKQELSEEAKKWLLSTKTEKVITIFCVSTSKKCEEIKAIVDEVQTKYKNITYYYNLDEIDEETKKTLKETYKIDDYASYTPYLFVTIKDKLINTHTGSFTKEEYIEFLKTSKVISEN